MKPIIINKMECIYCLNFRNNELEIFAMHIFI